MELCAWTTQLDVHSTSTHRQKNGAGIDALGKEWWLAQRTRLSADNVQLCALVNTLVRSAYHPVNSEAFEAQWDILIEIMLGNLVRTRSPKQMTLLTAQLSLVALRVQIYRQLGVISVLAPGSLASRDWTGDFAE
eukprot:5016399-Pleurochrysis_carterae.AAC.2